MKRHTDRRDIDDIHQLDKVEHVSMDTTYYSAMWHAARNEYIYSRSGRRWIDFTSAIVVANAGHSNKMIVRALQRSFRNPLLATYNFPHRHRFEITQTVRELFRQSTGEDYIAHFMSSGTEAVETALAVAREYSNKKISIIVSFYNSFHGNTQQSDAVSGRKEHSYYTESDGSEVHYVKMPYHHRQLAYEGEFEDELREKLDEYKLDIKNVIAVLFEPYQGKGVYVPHDDFIASVNSFCRKRKALLIFDEIQSGFYRTGTRFAFEHFKLSPDIVCIGKGLTSSLPMSAIVVKSKLFVKNTKLDIATTHTANPLSSVAASANIKFLESAKFQNGLPDTMSIFGERTKDVASRYPNIIDYSEVFGMVASIHIAKNGNASAKLAQQIAQACFERGLWVSMPNGKTQSFLRLTPPLTIRKKALNKAFDILDQILSEIKS